MPVTAAAPTRGTPSRDTPSRGTPPKTRPRALLVHKYARAARIAATLPAYGWLPRKEAYMRWLKAELEGAGCLFVKIGQWVASRTDVFPPAITGALAALHKDVSPIPPDEVRRVLEDEALADGDVLAIEPVPLSCGSVAQVHRGVYRGRTVAVKIQRPGVRDTVRGDLDVVKALMWPMQWHNRRSYADTLKSLDDLGHTILQETDFEREAEAMAAYQGFAAAHGLRVPAPILATPRVLIMEYVPSTPLTEAGGAGVRPADLTRRLMELFMAQFFELGRVHSDLHAGNLGLDESGRLVMYDFGSVTPCPAGMVPCFKRLCVSYLNRDTSIMLDYLLEYGLLTVGAGATLTADQRVAMQHFLDHVIRYVETTDIRAFHASLQGMNADAPPPLEFRPEVFMVFRSFTLLEGLCKDLDPSFVIMDAMMPYMVSVLADPETAKLKVEDDMRAVRALWAFLNS